MGVAIVRFCDICADHNEEFSYLEFNIFFIYFLFVNAFGLI